MLELRSIYLCNMLVSNFQILRAELTSYLFLNFYVSPPTISTLFYTQEMSNNVYCIINTIHL